MTTARRLAVFLLMLLVLAPPAAPAWGHASLVATDPANGAVLDEGPPELRLSFDAPVTANLGSVRLHESDSGRLTTEPANTVPGDDTTVILPLKVLGDGSYVAAWRVVSADGHPLQGSFSFQVGSGPTVDTSDLSQRALEEGQNSVVAARAFLAARFVEFASIIVLTGGLLTAVLLWPSALALRRSIVLFGVSWLLAFAVTSALVGLQAAYAGGLPLVDSFRVAAYRSVLETRFGEAMLLRLLALSVLAVFWLVALRRHSERLIVRVAAVLPAVAVLIPSSLAGHAGGARVDWWEIAVDVAHLTSVAMWVGGIVFLVTALQPCHPNGMEAAKRFSPLALLLAAVIVLTGLMRAFQEVESFGTIVTSNYGQLLVVKVALFLSVVFVAARTRRVVRRQTPDSGSAKVLRSRLIAEAALVAGVLAVTAALVTSNPMAGAGVEQPEPFAAYLQNGDVLVQVVVDPPSVGEATVHLYSFAADGSRSVDVPAMEASLTLTAENVTSLPVPLEKAGHGHFRSVDFQIPLTGQWRLDVAVPQESGEPLRLSAVVPVEEGE